MHTPKTISHDDDAITIDARTDDQMKFIHQYYAPPFDLIACEILDSLVQCATIEQIAYFSQLHVDTVRRTLQVIESTLCISSHSQIINNCHIRQWSSINSTQKNT